MPKSATAQTTPPCASIEDGRIRAVIDAVFPNVDGGRFAVKRVVGESIAVTAHCFTDGHDVLRVMLRWRMEEQTEVHEVPMKPLGNDVWSAKFTPLAVGRYRYSVTAWVDPFESWRDEMMRRIDVDDIRIASQVGAIEIAATAARAGDADQKTLLHWAKELETAATNPATDANIIKALALDSALAELAERYPERSLAAHSAMELPLVADRVRARFSCWYELFPRSASTEPGRHGTFKDVAARLPGIAAMGFDVLYFPPIHPIGLMQRKGKNNALLAEPDDVGSPWAIGCAEGGHKSILPALGTAQDFRQLLASAADFGIEIALDIAFQCAPDHPYVKDHPAWFRWRPDGSVQYAENPPKKYQDIYPLNFDNDYNGLYQEIARVVRFWMSHGVRIFRVDNPHTKPLPFWEWLIADIRERDRDVMFLSEAFTRPGMMARLGKIGYSQSYTYFTWRNTKAELSEYLTELNEPPLRDCYRPNFFVNTPDINPFFLQDSGRAGFLIRAALATMGSGLWGMYSGFELCESAAIPGKEEYLDSEKYQIRVRDYHAPGNIIAEIAQLNRIRRQNPALQTHLGFKAYVAWNDNILYFGKRTPDLSNFILVAISLDPHNAQEAHFELPLWELGLPDDAHTQGEDLMNGHRWTWYGKTQWMRIDPAHLPFGIWRLTAQQPDPDLK